jgi:hypothetical protein
VNRKEWVEKGVWQPQKPPKTGAVWTEETTSLS